MLTTSQNGWPVSDNPSDLGIVPLVVGGVNFGGGVRGGKVHDALAYVASAIHSRVQRLNSTYGCWGYSYRENVNSPGEWSNHASGTAIDINATLHGNDVPTSESWTDAQVAEIHKILDELNGVVRWGGDYQNTVDSMHFEVVVPPDQLGDSVTIPASSTVWPIGNPNFDSDWRATPELTTMSVSYPTVAAWGRNGYAYWFFRPVASGRLSFDAMLSHWMDDKLNASHPLGPDVTLYLYRATYNPLYDNWTLSTVASGSSFNAAFGLPSRSQGRFIADVTAGETYVVMTSASPAYPYVRTVVRIGDYAPQPQWVQPPDQEWVFGQAGGNRLPSSPGNPNGVSFSPWGSSVGFEGNSAAAHSFAGVYPGEDPDAVACTWKWARRTETSTFYWSHNNSGVWNGTDPYDPSVPAESPTCPVFTTLDTDCSRHFTDWPVGYYYGSEAPSGWLGGGYSNQSWRVFTTSCWFAPQQVIPNVGQSGFGTGYNAPKPDYLPTLQGAEYIEWESGSSTLVGLYWSWDEVNGGGGVQTTAPVVVKWYMGEFKEQADHLGGQWGPFGELWFGQAIGEDASSWAASQQHLGDTTGGYSNWYLIPENLWTVNKIRFTAMPDHIFGDVIPEMGQDIYGTGISIYKYRSGQYMAIRALVRPSRYRVIPDPGVPNLNWAGVTAISMAFDDGGKVLY
jgi:hypothetical protein